MKNRLIKNVKKLRFTHKGDTLLPHGDANILEQPSLLEIFDVNEEDFSKVYELILDLAQETQDYLFQHDIYLIEHKETQKRTLLVLNVEKLDLNSLIEIVDFSDIRLASEQTMKIFLKNSNSIGKVVDEKNGAEAFLHELFEKARISYVANIYIGLCGFTLEINYLESGSLKTVALLGAKEAMFIRYALASMSGKEATQRDYTAEIYIGKYEYRIQFFQTEDGYLAVIRVYGSDELGDIYTLKSLGYLEEEEEAIRSIFTYQYGLILMVAQTGQGKTTTQYAMMEELAARKEVVISIENPVEKRLKKVYQINLSRYATAEGKFKYTALEAVRDVLRAKPNVINMGEIRTIEEMKVAYTAASTGHLVLGTLHANDVAFAIDRLVKEAGLSVYDLKAVLRGVIYQFLTRKLCPYCKELIPGTESEYQRSKEGCPKCDRGYLSRTPVTEIAHFKFREDYNLEDPTTYEFYRTLQQSAEKKYALGFIDSIHRDIVIKGLREPSIEELDNGN